jgi:phosphoglycerate dehydrogenase-like enzyme
VDILLLENLLPEAQHWLEEKHSLAYLPELADQPAELRRLTYKVRALVLPRHVIVNREFLDYAPKLQVLARLHVGSDNTDLEACRERDIRVVQATNANTRSNAEYLLGGLLMLYRRGVVMAMNGQAHEPTQGSHSLWGREIHGSTIGLLGMGPTAHTLAPMLHALGVRLIGYDPAIHFTAPMWKQLNVEPVSLTDLSMMADAVSVQMLYASRYRNFISNNLLAACKPGQLWVGTSRSGLFDQVALAAALKSGRIDYCMLDGAEAGFAAPGTPLHNLPNLILTPRLGSLTYEARSRASWYVAQHIHDILGHSQSSFDQLVSRPMDLELPGDVPMNSSFADVQFIIR